MCDNDLVERLARAIQDAMAKAVFFGREVDPHDCARAGIKAIEAAGYVVVPREPTEKMLIKGDGIFEDKNYDRRDELREAYQAMIDATKDKANVG